MDMEKYLAKSDGTSLYTHTVMVANYAAVLADVLMDGNSCLGRIRDMCVSAAVLHDIGKLADGFQNGLESGECPEIRHNVVSWAFAKCHGFGNSVCSPILFHHVPFSHAGNDRACDIVGSLTDEERSRMDGFYDGMREIYGDRILPERDFTESTDPYDGVRLFDIAETSTKEARVELIVRAVLLKADRDVSSGKYDNMRFHMNDRDYMMSVISDEISWKFDQELINGSIYGEYDKPRLNRQIGISCDVADRFDEGDKAVVINASAGFGKTLTGLLRIFDSNRKTIWCVPTREIAVSTFESIKSELGRIDPSIPAALYFGNGIQDVYGMDLGEIGNYPIVVSVIDSILSRTTDNSSGHLLYDMLRRDMMFDEYHNVVTRRPLFAAASLLWETRISDTVSESVFLSATGIDLRNAGVKDTSRVSAISPEIHNGDIGIDFHYRRIGNLENDLPEILPNSFVITNTVDQAQTVYRILKGRGADNILLYHAGHTKDDLGMKREILFGNFGKGTPESRMIVVCTGIIGTGLDVSAENIYDFTLTPSDTLQRVCGRASRFGEYGKVGYFLCDVPESEPEIGRGNSKFIDEVFDRNLRSEFIGFMKVRDGETFTKSDLYSAVGEFMESRREGFDTFYRSELRESRRCLGKMEMGRSGAIKTGPARTSRRISFRGLGKDVFVVMEGSDIPMAYDSERVGYVEKDPDDAAHRKYRWKWYSGHVDPKELKSWRWRYGMKDMNGCNFDRCVELAYCSETPLPVMNFRYSYEFGIERK